VYIGGSNNGQMTRWSLTGTTLLRQEVGGQGGIVSTSADGNYLIGTQLNTGPQIFGNTATGVSPAFSPTPTLVASTTQPAATEGAGRRYSFLSASGQNIGALPIVGSLAVFGSGSSGGSTGNFISPHNISSDGRFVVGLGYISSWTSSAGTAIGANQFTWRAWVWDAQANAGAGGYTVLPTPFRTSTNTWRRRTGNAYAVSNDGLVILGAHEHNVSTTPVADPDGGRLVVWRWNPSTSTYDSTYLPNGVNGSGFPIPYSTTVGSVHMNAAGTIIVGPAVDNSSNSFIGKWVWNGTTWDPPVNLFSSLATPATWLPASVTGCGLPPTFTVTGMSDDASVVVGIARYSTCGSFMSGGFIYRASTGTAVDWYDHLNGLNAAGVAPNGFYGPIGDAGDPSKGLPRIGSPAEISPDGNWVVGQVFGPQLIPGAPSWVMDLSGATGCVAPSISSSTASPVNFSACSSGIILNVTGSGTAPLTYQWFKDGVPLTDGVTPSGSTVVGATTFQCRVNPPLTPSDVGTYYAVVTGQCGTPAQTSNITVQLDPAFPAVSNDVCSTAQVVTQGTNVLSPAQSPCGAYVDDLSASGTCFGTVQKADRWFVFTPATTGNYRLETCGANYDTVLTVFGGCGGAELACNNDHNVGPSTGCSATRSRIGSLSMTAGIPYSIRIAAPTAAFLSSTSTMNLSINPAPAPAAGNNCEAPATAVLGANALDTTEATVDFVALCNPVESRDVWFSFNPPARGTLRAATCPGTTWNTVLSVYQVCQAASDLGCNDNAGVAGCTNQSIVDVPNMVPGTSVLIRVGGNTATAFGAGTLTLTLSCKANFNNSSGAGNIVTVQDIFDFLADWSSQVSGGPQIIGPADFNEDGAISVQDIFDFLSDWNVCAAL
jgi:hypothetical protein